MRKLFAVLVLTAMFLGGGVREAKASEVKPEAPRAELCGYWVDMGYWQTVVVWDCYGYGHYTYVWVHNWVYVY